MSNLRALLSIALVVPAVACSDDGGSATPDATNIDAPATVDAPVTTDAPVTDAPVVNYDLSCLGNTAPTTATATVTLSGFAREITGSASIQAASGVTVTACKDNCQGPNDLGNATPSPTQASGDFATGALATGGTPLDGYLRATKTGNWPSLLYPASPIVANQAMVPVLMIQSSALPLLGLLAGIDQSDNNGIVGVFVTDCANMPVASGATVTFTQGGNAVGMVLDAGMYSAQAAGGYIAFNVPPGDTTVSATYNGMTFRAHVVPSVAGTTTTTQVRPGF